MQQRYLIAAAAAVSLFSVGSLQQGAAAAVSPAPSISFQPGNPVQDGSTVTVRTSDFPADSELDVFQCNGAAAPNVVCSTAAPLTLVSNQAGAASGTTTLSRKFDGTDDQGEPVAIDCAVSQECVLVAVTVDQDDEFSAVTKLSFSTDQR
ncbi:hypothetical protein GCM10010123_30940 [Pilimelia anulata]|uniref:Neocarzinostatin family protein n=1 Tax=Pilimelia anulata TaxID=53371 RepID=A0A8J3B7F6_9ACTN|nr:neocarzinostatin apoprotein domain-containing protein [Pilimelia anulata]GGJ98817.1 hypothetical protein GCM10010123_30940 [Pilimelia anulata]